MDSPTVWEDLQQDWTIDRRTLAGLCIDPGKPWHAITLAELARLADALDVLPSDMV